MTDSTDRDAAPAAAEGVEDERSVPTVDAAAAQEGHYPEPHGKHWWCAECLQVLDGEDGVCNLVLLARRVALLEGLLRSFEWLDDHGPTPETDWCPVCGWGRGEGHNPECRLAAALADALSETDDANGT